MDQKQIEDIVHAVMHKLKAAGGEETRTVPGQVTTASEVRHQPAVVPDEGALPDLGSDEIKTLVGVRQPHRKEVLEDLRHSTGTRIAGGRCGPRPRTIALLRFLDRDTPPVPPTDPAVLAAQVATAATAETHNNENRIAA